jgi:tetratricopeptide (TPR) repeat protein
LRLKGHVYRVNALFDQVEAHYREALELARDTASIAAEGIALADLVQTLAWCQPAEARRIGERALEINDSLRNQVEIVKIRAATAVALANLGDPECLLAGRHGRRSHARLFAAPSGNMLLNANSTARTVGGASRILQSVPTSVTLAISHDGQTLYACASNGPTVTLAAYSTATGAQIRVLHQWPGQELNCQISLDPTGRFLLAAVAPNVRQAWTLIGVDLRTSAPVTIPVRAALPYLGTQLAW